MKNKFPDWAPKIVIAEWQELLDEAEGWYVKYPTLGVAVAAFIKAWGSGQFYNA